MLVFKDKMSIHQVDFIQFVFSNVNIENDIIFFLRYRNGI